MWSTDEVVRVLTERGDLWQSAPGVTGLRGSAGALCAELERAIGTLISGGGVEEWRVPPAIPLKALERADYFTSFPQWLTVASHLDADTETMQRVATAASPALACSRALAPAEVALMPAVCYHVYASLADRVVPTARRVAVRGTCWRHEGERLAPLERGWAFTMLEVVCLGSPRDVEEFLACAVRRATDFAESIGLQATVADASDPFFAPTGRGKALLQRMKRLKRELLLPLDSDRTIAAASFNDHQTFFGEAFGIRDAHGAPISTGCMAFGIERWVLAWLAAYGPEPEGWPAIGHAVPGNGGY
jgi:seryl-tRNA synthetase